MDFLLSSEIWISLLTLSALEIVLGIDNIIFISILASKLPAHQQKRARQLGLLGALLSRLVLLSMIFVIVQLTEPLFTILDVSFSGKSIILLIGGLFLMTKATKEIHERLQGHGEHEGLKDVKTHTFKGVIIQAMLLDVVFSLDSVITAVGLTPYISIMVVANVLALGIMLLASEPIAAFVNTNPTIKVLAMSFLLMIGLVLVAEGLSFHIPKGYVYFAMGFSLMVEVINIRASKKTH